MEKDVKEIITKSINKNIYIEGDRVVKLFDETKNKADILNEALNQAWVEETGLSVPSLLEVRVIDGRWALVTRYIEGKTLQEMLDEQPEREDELLKWFVDLQVDMQSHRCPALRKHRDKMNGKIAQTDLSATLRYDLHNRIEAMPRHNDLCHGDYNPSNVMVDNNGKAYIIDWSHATQGNAEADAARTFMMFLVEDKKVRASKYLKYFAQASGCKIKDVLDWLPILAASQSVKGIRKQTGFLKNLIFMDEKGLEELYDEQI
ncbi:MAG: aminoglycoside phosphotransferase family protein [Erysipelotrichaceae bacterium]|nr:aminoglycoside phosphotransferase family protein [Erysipelotrichaceae bacterium]